jgi:Asp-tRNA(Asn)/Glu-tRNA(Gln) amidotransferase A subunit family amidase
MSELAFRGATELAAMLRDRELSSLELTNHYIERIDDEINAVVVRDFDRAREAARAADEELAKGGATAPLLGVPMTIKDSYDVAGLPIGLQAVCAEYDDLITIDFTRLLAREIGGFQPPPGYA